MQAVECAGGQDHSVLPLMPPNATMPAKGADMESEKGYVSVGAEVEDEVVPDEVTFRIRFGGRFPSKAECLTDYSAEQKKIKGALSSFGLADRLGCRRYSCYAHTTRKKAVVDGFDYCAYGTVSTPAAEIDAGEVWAALSTCGAHASSSVEFGFSDRRAAEDGLIGRAVRKARANAEALAAASGTSLGAVKHISYNASPSNNLFVCAASADCGPGNASDDGLRLEPEPIEVECSVEIEWWLEQ